MHLTTLDKISISSLGKRGKTGPGPLYLNWYSQLGRPMLTVRSIVMALCFDEKFHLLLDNESEKKIGT